VAAAVGNILDSEERVAGAAPGLACLVELRGAAEFLGRLET
jgi:hypothetical protein